MAQYTKDSLERLKERVDLIEVVSSNIPMHRSGSSYKGCCPFHEEKTPSFMIQKGDKHYHCFGCGAHGDAIAFLMGYMKMSFVAAIEYLAERFQVTLEKVEKEEKDEGPSKAQLKKALQLASSYYHFFLQHTEEGREPLDYLFSRGIDLAFIRKFEVGYALKQSDSLLSLLRAEGISDEVLITAGLMSISATGRKRDFFQERITFPIRDAMGSVIGFSARKFREETFGGKYINTGETPLFKKSSVLFGLSYSRHVIAKERKALIVEGQIDALRLIHEGFNYTVAGQGTAFGEGHVKELISLGVTRVYLALDADKAGKEAAMKIGDLFQHKGVEVFVVAMSEGSDPDTFLREKGPEQFSSLLKNGEDYLQFCYVYMLGTGAVTPAKKNEVVEALVERIKKWQHPVLVHESLKKLAALAGVPELTVGLSSSFAYQMRGRSESLVKLSVDPNRILESDLLRWLILSGEHHRQFIHLARKNISAEIFKIGECKNVYEALLQADKEGQSLELLSLAPYLKTEEDEMLLTEITQRKINLQKAEEGMKESLKKLLQRQWMEERELIRSQIQLSTGPEEEVMQLVRRFDELKKTPPEILL